MYTYEILSHFSFHVAYARGICVQHAVVNVVLLVKLLFLRRNPAELGQSRENRTRRPFHLPVFAFCCGLFQSVNPALHAPYFCTKYVENSPRHFLFIPLLSLSCSIARTLARLSTRGALHRKVHKMPAPG